MNEIINLNDQNFDSEVLSEDVVLVEFGAIWCGPCQFQNTVLEKFHTKFGETVKVCKVDIDDCPKTTSKYSIKSVPTIIFFKNGKPFNTRVGLNSLSSLELMIS
jgi:thioredoxin 1